MRPPNAFYWNGKNFDDASGAPLDADKVPDYQSGPLPETPPHAVGIAAATQALRDSHPDALRPTEWTRPC